MTTETPNPWFGLLFLGLLFVFILLLVALRYQHKKEMSDRDITRLELQNEGAKISFDRFQFQMNSDRNAAPQYEHTHAPYEYEKTREHVPYVYEKTTSEKPGA